MTATTAYLPNVTAGRHRLSFIGVVQSEWIKLRSVRSTWWSLGLWLVLSLGINTMVTISMMDQLDWLRQNTGDLHYYSEMMGLQWVIMVGFVIVPLIATMAMTSEYTGSVIKSTFSAAPRRMAVYSAKALVVALAVGITAAISALACWLVNIALYSSHGVETHIDATAGRMFGMVVASIVLVALLCFGIGTMLRSTAAGVTAGLGVVLGLSLAVQILAQFASWANRVRDFIPYTLVTNQIFIEPGRYGFGTMLGLLAIWSTAALIAGAIVLESRDA